MDSEIQILPDGRRYLMRDGKQIFISPVAYGAKPPKDETGIFRSAPRWNQATGKWETPIDWSNIANIGMAGALTGGVLAAGAGGAGAAGGGLGAATAGAASSALAPTAAGVVGATGGGLGALTGGGGAGTAATAATTGSRIADAVSSAIPAVAGLAGGAGDKQELSPEALALINQQRARLEQSNPLYQDVMQLAFNRMPTASREGLSVPSFDEVSASVPDVGEGDYAEDPATRGLLRQQLIRSKMSDPVLQAVLKLARSRMPNRG